ncbi:MAG: 4'-phosphopantetheinyl transferase family protein [Methylomonas sp.]
MQMQRGERSVKQHFVDVWSGHLTLETERLKSLADVMSDSEREKAQAFKLPLMRDRYMAARVLIRQTLACYLQTDPASLQFEAGEYGKPCLTSGSLHFNISHTGDFLLIAVGDFPDIGVDMESIKPRSSMDSLARRCFSDREFDCWRQLRAEQQLRAFYRLWTKKEAFVKAVGRGIALGLDQCEVEMEEGGQLLAIPAEYGPANAWKVVELTVAADACVALVAPDCGFVLRELAL